jgi:hypothetical protein
VTELLQAAGITVRAVVNPLRGIGADSAYVVIPNARAAAVVTRRRRRRR